jgi:hypothetical protein
VNDKEAIREIFKRANMIAQDMKVDREGNETMLRLQPKGEYLNLYMVFDRHGQLHDIFFDN